MSRSLNLFLDWDAPTSYAVEIDQSDGLNSDINAQALSSKDYHKYEPRRAKASFFRDQFSGNNLLKFDYLIDGENIPTKWNKYKACIKDEDTILFRGIIDNTSIKYKESRYETSVTIHDIITLLNHGLDNLDKTYTWPELSTPQSLQDLLSEIVENSLQHGDRDMATPSNWYLFDYEIPTYTASNDIILSGTPEDEFAEEIESGGILTVSANNNYLRDDGDYLRLYRSYTIHNPTAQFQDTTYYKIYIIESGQVSLDFSAYSLNAGAPPFSFTTNSGFSVQLGNYPEGNNYEYTMCDLDYVYSPFSGNLTASGTLQMRKVFLSKDGATEATEYGQTTEGMHILSSGFDQGGKSFSYRELFRLISYLWNLSIHTNTSGVIEFTNKNSSGNSPTAISDSDLSGTEYKSLLYTQPDIDSIFKPLAQSWVKPIIKRIADESYSGVYGTKIIKTTIPSSYGLALDSAFTAYDKEYKVAKIKNNKRGTFSEIEGWSQ